MSSYGFEGFSSIVLKCDKSGSDFLGHSYNFKGDYFSDLILRLFSDPFLDYTLGLYALTDLEEIIVCFLNSMFVISLGSIEYRLFTID